MKHQKLMVLTWISAIGFALSSLVFNAYSAEDDMVFAHATITVKDLSLDVEYAKTAQQRARGLMFRKDLCEDCGMLFLFTPPRRASMWMKNTFVPLDVAFIDRDGVITDIKPLQPHDLTSVGASTKVMYALEMNQGWFAKNKIKVGDQILVQR